MNNQPRPPAPQRFEDEPDDEWVARVQVWLDQWCAAANEDFERSTPGVGVRYGVPSVTSEPADDGGVAG